MLVVVNFVFVVCCLLFAACRQQFTVCCLLVAVCLFFLCLLFVIYGVLRDACQLMLIGICCLLFVVCCVLFRV